MRARRLVAPLLALALGACATNPDPRPRSIESVQRDGHGGWIVVTGRNGTVLAGELISIEQTGLRLLTYSQQPVLYFVRGPDIAKAKLYPYQTRHGRLGVWGALGTLSTISHGFVLVLSAPIWIISSSVAAASASHAPILSFPGDGWDEFAAWARFPQGLPPGIASTDLVLQTRQPPAPPASPAPVDTGPVEPPPAVEPMPPPTDPVPPSAVEPVPPPAQPVPAPAPTAPAPIGRPAGPPSGQPSP